MNKSGSISGPLFFHIRLQYYFKWIILIEIYLKRRRKQEILIEEEIIEDKKDVIICEEEILTEEEKKFLKLFFKNGQSFYDYGGTIVRFGRFAHIDASTKSLLHLAALGFNHIPIGTIAAGFIGGF